MEKNWDQFFQMLIEHEGGFTDDPHDPGNAQGDGHGNTGSTMLGVTAFAWSKYTNEPSPPELMRNLTVDMVEPFYKSQYWDAIKGDELPSGVDVSCADLCVNAGPGRAAKILQKVVGATADGAIGPATLAAVNAMEPSKILTGYYEERESFYKGLSTYPRYGRGWSRRNTETLEKAKELLDA